MSNNSSEKLPNIRSTYMRPSFILIVSLLFGLFLGTLAGLGYVLHDGKPWSEGLLAGLGFFVFGFLLMYLRFARRIAEFLSSVS